ncbi:MAG: hypothetical protein IPM89_14490 [Candidatus Competibacteraceae bacterium]|nr:MAG: hypothetical protein IPM89_14490 [Candidatus Competibacteraceae bacterium]
MTLLDLVVTLRRRLDDFGGDTGPAPPGYTYYWEYDDGDCLWSNADLVDLINEAQNEFCRRRPLRGAMQLALTAGTTDYAIQESGGRFGANGTILSIQAIHRQATGQPVRKIDKRHLDPAVAYPPVSVYQEDAPVLSDYSPPFGAIVAERSIRILGTPEAAETLVLTVERLPDAWYVPEWSGRKFDEPEIAPQFHRVLVEYAAHLAFLKRDFDTFNPDLAAQALALFDRTVGPPQSAVDWEWRRRKANTRPRATPQFL